MKMKKILSVIVSVFIFLSSINCDIIEASTVTSQTRSLADSIEMALWSHSNGNEWYDISKAKLKYPNTKKEMDNVNSLLIETIQNEIYETYGLVSVDLSNVALKGDAAGEYITKIHIDYTNTLRDTQRMKLCINSRIPNKPNGFDYLSDIDKLRFCESIVLNKFTYGGNSSNIYEAVVSGNAVCEQYAEFMDYLIEYYDVGVNKVFKVSDNHMWNCVELDGKWYNIDTTWDDTCGLSYWKYFVKSDNFYRMNNHGTWETASSRFDPNAIYTDYDNTRF